MTISIDHINNNYWFVTDSSPGTQVWAGDRGAFVALGDATYLSWLSTGGVTDTIDTFAHLMAQINGYNQSVWSGQRRLYNAQTISANTAVTTPIASWNQITNTTSNGLILKLPQANLPGSPPIGGEIVFDFSNGSKDTIIDTYDSAVTVAAVGASNCTVVLIDNSTARGTWKAFHSLLLSPTVSDFGSVLHAIPSSGGEQWTPSNTTTGGWFVNDANSPGGGYFRAPTLTNTGAPSLPAAGNTSTWIDSTDKRFHDKNDAGTIGTTVVSSSAGANQFATAVSAAGVVTWSALPSSFTGLANPTASVGLSAVNGSATTAMRSDGAPALSQSIAPTWTGTHTWSSAGIPVNIDSTNSAQNIQMKAAGVTTAYFGGAAGTPLFVQNPSGYNTVSFADGDTGTPTNGNYPIIKRHANGTGIEITVGAYSDTNVDININPIGTGLVKFGNSASMTANGSVATAMSSLGPTGSHTTIQEWLTVKNSSGTTRYIPCF